MPSVNINGPASNSTVTQTFVATGTASAAPTVRIETSTGGLIANATVVFDNGNWSANFALTMDLTGCRIVAEVTGANATATNITVFGTGNNPGGGGGD